MPIGLRIPLQQIPPEPKKRDRSVFLYEGPQGDPDKFATCESCDRYAPKAKRCAILGTALAVLPTDSCNKYTYGKPHEQEIRQANTPEEIGFVRRKVRCEHCVSFDAKGSRCEMFKSLNDLDPEHWDLDEGVDPYGCCSGQKPRKPLESATRSKA